MNSNTRTQRHRDIKTQGRKKPKDGFRVSGLHVFCVIVLLCLFSGCIYSEFNLATGQEETLIYNTEREERIGSSVAVKLEKDYKISDDPAVNQRVNDILARIVEVCDRKELVYSVKVIDEDLINAASLPGGYVYVFQGLIDKITSDDQLAAVIAHEIGHITARHAMKRLQASYGMAALQVFSIAVEEPELAKGVAAAYAVVFSAYSRQDEFQADKLSVRYLERAGYDPMAVIEVLKILQEEARKRAPRRLAYFRTHPYAEERMGVAKREITGTLDFESYLDLTGQESDMY